MTGPPRSDNNYGNRVCDPVPASNSCAFKSGRFISSDFWAPRSTARTTDIAYNIADVYRDDRPTDYSIIAGYDSWSVSGINDRPNDNESDR